MFLESFHLSIYAEKREHVSRKVMHDCGVSGSLMLTCDDVKVLTHLIPLHLCVPARLSFL